MKCVNVSLTVKELKRLAKSYRKCGDAIFQYYEAEIKRRMKNEVSGNHLCLKKQDEK